MNNAEKKLILLAEDDDSMRRFVEITLTKAGFEVFAAEDGLIAMQFALENVVDAVIADAIMPNLSGFDLCRMINENSAKKIPCIILSGLEQNSSQQTTEKIADMFLAKDAKLKVNLIDALNKLL
jgi:DNA-binding response OmpR family regulator